MNAKTKAKKKAIKHIEVVGFVDAGFDHNNIHFQKAIDIALENYGQTDIEESLMEIFQEHNFVLVDTNLYGSRKINIPQNWITSPQWLARVLIKKVSGD